LLATMRKFPPRNKITQTLIPADVKLLYVADFILKIRSLDLSHAKRGFFDKALDAMGAYE